METPSTFDDGAMAARSGRCCRLPIEVELVGLTLTELGQ